MGSGHFTDVSHAPEEKPFWFETYNAGPRRLRGHYCCRHNDVFHSPAARGAPLRIELFVRAAGQFPVRPNVG